jgi:hypothetical protein
MKKLPIYISLLFVLTCAKEDSQLLNTSSSQIVKQYTLTASAGQGGSVSTSGGTFNDGTSITITATPSQGYSFGGWSNGSNENPIIITLNTNTIIEANFQPSISFTPNLPYYSTTNQNTSEYFSQYYFKNYMTRNTHESIFWDEGNIRYMIQEVDAVYYDFDFNGTLDFFGFAYWSNLASGNGEWGTNPGKYVLIKDYFLGNREKIIFDTENSFGGKMNLGDFDNNGSLDVVNFSFNAHQNFSPYNSSLMELPAEFIKIDSNLNFTSTHIGPIIGSHDGSSGDIDNDGDIDILLIHNRDTNEIREYSNYPIVLLNVGNGEFVEKYAFTDNSNFISLNNVYMSEFNDYESLHYNLFDLNSDGNLDIISGFHLETNDQYEIEERTGIDVFWGDGSGDFTTINSSKIYTNNSTGYKYSILGTSFLDYDGDGDLDIFSVSTRSESDYNSSDGVIDDGEIANFYNNYAIHLFQNNNGEFDDVTNISFDKSKDLSKTKFSHFYDLNFKDIDGDGDFDLMPSRTSGFFTFPQLNNLFWENVNGYFIIREEGGLNYYPY